MDVNISICQSKVKITHQICLHCLQIRACRGPVMTIPFDICLYSFRCRENSNNDPLHYLAKHCFVCNRKDFVFELPLMRSLCRDFVQVLHSQLLKVIINIIIIIIIK